MIINIRFEIEESFKLEALRKQGVQSVPVVDETQQKVGVYDLQNGDLYLSASWLNDGYKLSLVFPVEEESK